MMRCGSRQVKGIVEVVYLVVLAVDLVDGVFVLLVHAGAWWWLVFHRTYFLPRSVSSQRYISCWPCWTHTMPTKTQYLTSISEAPLTHIQPIRLPPPDRVFRVEGRIPWLNVQIPEHDARDVRRHGVGGGRGGVGRAVRRGKDWWCGRRGGDHRHGGMRLPAQLMLLSWLMRR